MEDMKTWFDRPLIDTKWTKAYKGSDLVTRSELLLHPVDYMTTLVQLGYEPLPPKLSKSLFGRTVLQLPGFYSYMSYIVKTDGFFGVYRGLRFNIAYSITYRFVYKNADNLQRQLFSPVPNEEDKYRNITNLTRSLTVDTCSRFAALGLAYPIHVMMVRSMAQFIGRETYYDTFVGAIIDIYQTGGLSGFYSGFIPFFLGQCVLLYLESGVIYLLRNHLDKDLELKNSLVLSSINLVTRSLTYPFRIVSTVMSCNGSNARSLAASALTAPGYPDWMACWQDLWQRGEIKRGQALVWRKQPFTSSIMFPMQPLTPFPNTNLKRN